MEPLQHSLMILAFLALPQKGNNSSLCHINFYYASIIIILFLFMVCLLPFFFLGISIFRAYSNQFEQDNFCSSSVIYLYCQSQLNNNEITWRIQNLDSDDSKSTLFTFTNQSVGTVYKPPQPSFYGLLFDSLNETFVIYKNATMSIRLECNDETKVINIISKITVLE